jgi:hypothetical protein
MENGLKDRYRDAVEKIKRAVEQGVPFDQACSDVDIRDREIKEAVARDALRAFISEMHFSEGMPLKQLAMRLKISLSRLMNTKASMQREEAEFTETKQRAAIAGRLGIL